MRHILRLAAAVPALTLVLSSCGGGGHSTPVAPVVPNANAPQQPTTSQSNATIAYGAETTVGAVAHGAVTTGLLDFGVLVRQRDPIGLMNYARDVSDPHSGMFHQWLTPAQVADRFGATVGDYQAVARYFASKGILVGGWQQRQLLRIAGTQAQLESALGAKFGSFTKKGTTFHALMSAPAALKGLPIAALVGASNYATAKRSMVRLSNTPGQISGFGPQQIAAAFDYNGAYAAGQTGVGISIGIIGTGPISAADVPTYRSIYNVAGTSTVTQVNVTNSGASTPVTNPNPGPTLDPVAHGFSIAPPTTSEQCNVPSTGPDATCNPEDIEAQLDTEQTAGLARDASILFYLGYAKNAYGNGFNAEGIYLVNYEVQQVISDNRADIISMSYGEGEEDDVGYDFVLNSSGQVDFTQSIGPLQFATLAAMGITAFASSGDSGALECNTDGNPNTMDDLCVSYPATDPNVVAVGGVNAPIAANGRLQGPLTGWGLQTGLGAFRTASGGGVSRYFPVPSYQTGAVGVTAGGRNSPDLSLLADGATGASVLYDAAFPDGGIFDVSGTSIAAPQAAAMWALVLSSCASAGAACAHSNPGSGGKAYRYGNPNPLFYQIYASSTQYPATFSDVLFGDNSQLPNCAFPGETNATPCPTSAPTPIAGYTAGTGYDRVTGLGVPAGRALIRAITGQ